MLTVLECLSGADGDIWGCVCGVLMEIFGGVSVGGDIAVLGAELHDWHTSSDVIRRSN
jgi:uncharacterized membrane protein